MCQRQGSALRPHGHLQKIQGGARLDLVTMDVLSGLPTTTDGSKYVLMVVYAFTKWVEAYALPDQEASTCMTAAYNGFSPGSVYLVSSIPTKAGISSPPWSGNSVV